MIVKRHFTYRILLIGAGLTLSVATATAQDLSFALFGGAGVGVGAYDNGAFSDRLSSWSPIGEQARERVYRTERVSGTGLSATGELGMMATRRLYLGLSGEKVFYPSTTAITSNDDVGTYVLSSAGGEVEFGYAFVNDDGSLITPIVGAGLYGYSLSFDNGTTDSIPLFEGDPIAPGTTANYSGSAPRVGLGILLHRFIGGLDGQSRVTAPVLSFRLIWSHFFSRPEWERNGSAVNNGGHTPCYNGLSLTVTIGGGFGSL